MSEPLWEVNEEILGKIVDEAKATSRYSEAGVQRISSFLQKRHAGQASDILGATVSAEEVLPLIVPPESGK